MITRDKAVRRVAGRVRAAVRPFGFTGNGTGWVLANEHGTAYIAQSRRTNPDGVSLNVILISLDVSVTPAAYHEYRNWREVRSGHVPAGPVERARIGIGLMERRGLPSYPKCLLRPDPSQLPYLAYLPGDVDQAEVRLAARAHDYARRAVHLLEPGNYLAELLADPSDGIGMWEPRVVLLAERGPSPELDAAIGKLYAAYRERRALEEADRIVEYVRQRAADCA